MNTERSPSDHAETGKWNLFEAMVWLGMALVIIWGVLTIIIGHVGVDFNIILLAGIILVAVWALLKRF